MSARPGRLRAVGAGLLGAIPAIGYLSARDLAPVAARDGARPTIVAIPEPMPALDSLVEATVEDNPFRLDRSPADVSAGDADRAASPPPPRPPRPQPPVLTALLGGDQWRAILENVPGSERAMIVSVGMQAGPFKVLSVGPQGVRLSSGDTAWRIRLKGQ